MRAVLLAAVVSMVGCIGQLDDGNDGIPDPGTVGTNPNPTPDSVARKMFEQNVYPLINKAGAASDCSSSGCHLLGGTGGSVTKFVAPTLTDSYGTITSYQAVVGNFAPSQAGILTKVEPGPHHGRAYTAAERQAISDWLNEEVKERAANPPPPGTGSETPGQATARLLNTWSACMTLTNFTTAQMPQGWGNLQANNGEQCRTCHNTGGFGFIATNLADNFFAVLSTQVNYMAVYFTVDLSDLTRGTDGKFVNAKVMINTTAFQGVAENKPPHVQHPSFNYADNNGMTALTEFYNLTKTAVTAGNCGATKLDPPLI